MRFSCILAILLAITLVSGCGSSSDAQASSSNKPIDRLGGTQWKFNSVVLTFNSDGTYFFSDWGDKRGTWKGATPQSVDTVTYAGLKCEFTINPNLAFIAWRDGNGEFGLATRLK